MVVDNPLVRPAISWGWHWRHDTKAICSIDVPVIVFQARKVEQVELSHEKKTLTFH